MTNKWSKVDQENHLEVITDLLKYINKDSDQFILKGGTGLLYAYGLDRFSEDIDLDARSKKNVLNVLENYSNFKKYNINITKDTNTVKRVMLNYGSEKHKLKIETSYRRKNFIDDKTINDIDGVKVYTINSLFSQKLTAMNSRSQIRDVYDVGFIYKNYKEQLSNESIYQLVNSLDYKGIEYMDYLLTTQDDPLIDRDELEMNFLFMYEDLQLEDDNLNSNHEQRINKKERQIINHFFNNGIER